MRLSDSEVGTLRQKTLSVLTASELVTSCNSSATFGPGSTQYLLSLARVGLSAGVEFPELWDGPQLKTKLLDHLLQCPQYEVRELALEGLLRKLEEEEEEERKRRPEWLDETTQSNLTSLALHETHPQCLAKVRPHAHTDLHKRILGVSFVCCVFVWEPVYTSSCFIYMWTPAASSSIILKF